MSNAMRGLEVGNSLFDLGVDFKVLGGGDVGRSQ